jgi:phosphoribosyl-AMP cyclohydrolase
VDRVELVPGLDAALLEGMVARLRELEPPTIAVLVSGSYAKGMADESSDLDVQVATNSAPLIAYRMWFEERPGSSPLHVSAGAKSLAAWLAKRDEPQGWALGFPVEHVVRYVWATDEARAALGEPPSNMHPPGEPQLEDFVEYVQKLRRAAAGGKQSLVRMYAHQAALLAPTLLRLLNEDVVIHDRAEALGAALALAVVPEHYRDDLVVCLGLVAADDERVQRAALRLARELLAFLRERKPDVDPQPDISRYLADGTLERHLGFDSG